MKKLTIIFLLLAGLMLASPAHATQKYRIEISISDVAADISFGFTAHHVEVCVESTTDSAWFDDSGSDAVADAADPTTHPTVFRVPPAAAANLWTCSSQYYDSGISFISAIAASGKTPKIKVEAEN